MTGKLILPPHYEENLEGPVIFLAGPIQGAIRWQDQAIEYLQKMAPEINIACPRRVLDRKHNKKEFSIEMYNEQVDWETSHLKLAAKNGVVFFWLAKENKHNPRRAYAQTSRFELGEAKHKYQTGVIKNLVLGIEEGFTNARYIRRRFSQDCPNVRIQSTLEGTCNEAIAVMCM